MKRFHIYFQYLQKYKEILILEAYSRMERSKYEVEKQTNKL